MCCAFLPQSIYQNLIRRRRVAGAFSPVLGNAVILPNKSTMTPIAIPLDTHGLSWWINDDIDSPKPTTYNEQAIACKNTV